MQMWRFSRYCITDVSTFGKTCLMQWISILQMATVWCSTIMSGKRSTRSGRRATGIKQSGVGDAHWNRPRFHREAQIYETITWVLVQFQRNSSPNNLQTLLKNFLFQIHICMSQIVLKYFSQNMFVMVNFMHQPHWAMGRPIIGLNMRWDAPGRVFLDKITIGICRPSEANCLPECWLGSSSPLRT